MTNHENEHKPGNERSMDLEQERIQELHDSVANIVAVKDLNIEMDPKDIDPVENAIKRFLTYEREPSTSLYLDPDISKNFESIDSFIPLMARGRRSAHGVFFGVIDNGKGKQIEVAVKPHRLSRTDESCLDDYFKNEAVRQFGFDTLTPVGMLLDRNRAYSMTRLDESLTSFDTIDWSDFYDKYDENPGMYELWQHTGRILGTMHAMGSITHGDLAARNIAVTADGGVLFFDWEKAFVSLQPARDAEVRYGQTHDDLATLMESMARSPRDVFKGGIGLFKDEGKDWWQGFRELVFDEYVQYRLAVAETGNHHSAKLAEVESELEQLAISLQSDAAMLKKICTHNPDA